MPKQPQKDTLLMGERIRHAREAKGWSQEDTVQRMNELLAVAEPDSPYYGAKGYSSPSGLSRAESGVNAPNRRNLHLLAAALDVAPEELYVTKIMMEEPANLLDLPFIELEHISVPARASFIEMCGTESDYGTNDTVRLYLSSSNDRVKYEQAKVITSWGDSMEGVIENGQKVIIRFIPKSKWEYIVNTVCVVAYEDTVTIKGIVENTLFSEKRLALYPSRADQAPLSVPLSSIKCIWEVVEFFDRPKVSFKRI